MVRLYAECEVHRWVSGLVLATFRQGPHICLLGDRSTYSEDPLRRAARDPW